MSKGYFIAPNAYGDVCLWREHGDTPIEIIAQYEFRRDPAVWNVIVAWVQS